MILGAGGTARSIAVCIAQAGIAEIRAANRTLNTRSSWWRICSNGYRLRPGRTVEHAAGGQR